MLNRFVRQGCRVVVRDGTGAVRFGTLMEFDRAARAAALADAMEISGASAYVVATQGAAPGTTVSPTVEWVEVLDVAEAIAPWGDACLSLNGATTPVPKPRIIQHT